ncbi:hypothetical protein [Fructobacillus tropaeoli]|uniref:hypothetical protein n=1 Tax=Fructobacillus tropaeoli TaxID=709323 RepID=UPI002DACAB65|nr:unnamed protein product [Fructobacillus tropaeoli]
MYQSIQKTSSTATAATTATAIGAHKGWPIFVIIPLIIIALLTIALSVYIVFEKKHA